MNPVQRLRRGKATATLLSAAAVSIIAVACSSSSTDPVPTPVPPEPTPTTQAPVTGTGLTNGLVEFDAGAASNQAYWYSRYTLGSVAMMSGLGVRFEPPPEAVMGMVAAVDKGPESGEHVLMPQNAALLRAVFASGDPALTRPFNGNPSDLSNFNWDVAKMDTAITPSAQAQTVIKEVEWAKFFNNPGWAGGVDAEFGAMDRFKGMVMYAEAGQQLSFALANMRNQEGMFVSEIEFVDGSAIVTDGIVAAADQFQMLQAMSDMRLLLQESASYNGVYVNPELQTTLTAETDALIAKLDTLSPTGLRDLGLGAQAVTWYAASATDGSLQNQALELLRQYGDAILAEPRNGTIEHARAARGLLEAARVLGDARYYDAATSDINAMLDAYNFADGKFNDFDQLKDWELGDILGALNSARLNAGSRVDSAKVLQAYANFFESVVNVGGLLQAKIPKEMEASPFELERFTDDLLFAYPGIPAAPEAAGEFGTAAVHASEMRYDQALGRWVITNSRFDTAGGMHTSNEMMWTFGIVSGFPQIGDLTVLKFPPVSPTS